MSQKDIQDYLDKGIHGVPELKPEEKRKYLGNFRERVILAMSEMEMKQKNNQLYLKEKCSQHPEAKLFIAAKVAPGVQATYMQIAQELTLPFTIVQADNHSGEEAADLVLASETALNIDDISVPKTPKKTKKKKIGFFNQLFS